MKLNVNSELYKNKYIISRARATFRVFSNKEISDGINYINWCYINNMIDVVDTFMCTVYPRMNICERELQEKILQMYPSMYTCELEYLVKPFKLDCLDCIRKSLTKYAIHGKIEYSYATILCKTPVDEQRKKC